MQRRERILEAALEAVEGGGTDIGVQQIAERAQVPRSVVYRIFADRGDLDEQIRLRIIEVMMTELGPVLTPHGTVREAIDSRSRRTCGGSSRTPRLHAFSARARRAARPWAHGPSPEPRRRSACSWAHSSPASSTAVGSRRRSRNRWRCPVGLVDATVNRWLSQPENPVPSADLARFLERPLERARRQSPRAGCRARAVDDDPPNSRSLRAEAQSPPIQVCGQSRPDHRERLALDHVVVPAVDGVLVDVAVTSGRHSCADRRSPSPSPRPGHQQIAVVHPRHVAVHQQSRVRIAVVDPLEVRPGDAAGGSKCASIIRAASS